jgi:aminoglycoside 6'-N-acetyltransferase
VRRLIVENPTLACGLGLRLRQVVEADRPRLAAILTEPSVAQWWHTHDLDAVIDRTIDAHVWAIEEERGDGWTVVGGVQAWALDDPEYEHAGIDLFVSTAAQGRGVGRTVVRTVARWLFEVRGHHRIVIDPAAANARAIRAYSAVGFRPVGVMRAYERRPDGTWADGLLMDLLPDDLAP